MISILVWNISVVENAVFGSTSFDIFFGEVGSD